MGRRIVKKTIADPINYTRGRRIPRRLKPRLKAKKGDIGGSEKKIVNPMNTRTNKALLNGHAILHAWWRNPKKTFWTKIQIIKEHARVVKIMKSRGMKHNSPLVRISKL